MGGFGDGRRGGGPTVEGSDALVLGAGEVVRPLAEAARRRGLAGRYPPHRAAST